VIKVPTSRNRKTWLLHDQVVNQPTGKHLFLGNSKITYSPDNTYILLAPTTRKSSWMSILIWPLTIESQPASAQIHAYLREVTFHPFRCPPNTNHKSHLTAQPEHSGSASYSLTGHYSAYLQNASVKKDFYIIDHGLYII
jgi:hypothetical protein